MRNVEKKGALKIRKGNIKHPYLVQQTAHVKPTAANNKRVIRISLRNLRLFASVSSRGHAIVLSRAQT